MNTSRFCSDERRRRTVRAKKQNGLDYLEVNKGQLKLTLLFLGQAPTNLTPANIRIDGGARIRNIKVLSVYPCLQEDPELDDRVQVTLDRWGDFSTYTLRLVEPDAHGGPGQERLAGFDPRYSHLDFNFKVDCPSEFDCRSLPSCPPVQRDEPEISYLAKDYSSFRQLILDRMALVMPEWKERHVPDLGITLVELLAYTGDYLSYYQDAVATEAYLDTARQRVSVRRHARLVDYPMHEGVNARAWVCVEASSDETLPDLKDIYFITGHNDALRLNGSVLSAEDLRDVDPHKYEVFEPITFDPPAATSSECNGDRDEELSTGSSAIKLFHAHNRIGFYTWGDRDCCLPRGATSAVLIDGWMPKPPAHAGASDQGAHSKARDRNQNYEKTPVEARSFPERKLQLKVGDVVIFEEVRGARTGAEADADPSHRHAVRLVRVEPLVDDLYDPPRPIVEIEWAADDALPFPLCISSIGEAPDCANIQDISVARGNVILVDHGLTVKPESWNVPGDEEHDAGCEEAGEPLESILQAGRFRPQLKFRPLTHRTPFPSPATIAREQARLLGKLLARVMSRVTELWRKARAGQSLSSAETAELSQVFGAEALTQAGYPTASEKDHGHHSNTHTETAHEQAAAIEKLISNAERLLWKKSRRAKVLGSRALAGYVLRAAAAQEISELFGAQFAVGLEPTSPHTLGPAKLAFEQDAREALPVISITEQQGDKVPDELHDPRWAPHRDLLGSHARDRHFVAEVNNDGDASLRFGDGELGRAPEPGTKLTATYRVGNGSSGNVGPEAISHIVFRRTKMSGLEGWRVRNPLPARGGAEPEPLAEVKLFAPSAFRKQLQRAITTDDYARLAESNASVQRAAASIHWTGAWYEVRVAIDPLETAMGDEYLLEEVETNLSRYRRVGHDLKVVWARYVPLEVAMEVCVLPLYLRGHVKAAVVDLFGKRLLPGGTRGFFHPDNLSFGEGIYLSRLVAAAQAVAGVESVKVTKLQRLFETPNHEIENGVLPLGALEVARLDNDPSFPENGRLTIDINGGR